MEWRSRGTRVQRRERPVKTGLNPAPCAISAPTRPRIVIAPASGLINPLSIFNSVVLIRAFPRRLTLRAACGSVDSLVPTRLTLRAACGSLSPDGRLSHPSGCLAAVSRAVARLPGSARLPRRLITRPIMANEPQTFPAA